MSEIETPHNLHFHCHEVPHFWVKNNKQSRFAQMPDLVASGAQIGTTGLPVQSTTQIRTANCAA